MNRTVLIALHGFLATTAFAAGRALAIRPDGSALGFDQAWLESSPFPDYRVPGLFLAIVLGGTNAASTLCLTARRPFAAELSFGTGLLLLVWLGIQTAIIGVRHPSQAIWPVMFGLVTFLAWREVRGIRAVEGEAAL